MKGARGKDCERLPRIVFLFSQYAIFVFLLCGFAVLQYRLSIQRLDGTSTRGSATANFAQEDEAYSMTQREQSTDGCRGLPAESAQTADACWRF